MMIVASESLAKSEVEISVATVATLLVSASKMITGEVLPNFEAIVEQNEMSFAQKRKDISVVRGLLIDEESVVPTLQKAADTVRKLRLLSEAIVFDTIASVQTPTKPLPEGSLLRDTLRRLQYVQKVVESVAKWINDVGEHDSLKGSVLYTKTQQELIRAFKCVVIQVQQATVIIGKYRDMGDIRVLREMTIEAQAVLGELKEADESVSEKRKSISFFKRAVEESKAAPKVVRQLASVTAGLVVVVLLSFVVIKLNALAPQVFPVSEPASEGRGSSTLPQGAQPTMPQANAQEKQAAETPIKSETTVAPKEIAPLVPHPIATPSAQEKLATKEQDAIKPNVNKPQAPAPTKTSADAPEHKAKLSPPVLKKASSKSSEIRTKKSPEQQLASPKAPVEREAGIQKKSERVAPKRKTIVIED
jgi:hypothetical protein